MARDELGLSPTQVAQLVTRPGFPAADERGLASFRLDEAVRLATHGKGYKPAPQWALCPHCAQPVSTREKVAIEVDAYGKPVAFYHARCR